MESPEGRKENSTGDISNNNNVTKGKKLKLKGTTKSTLGQKQKKVKVAIPNSTEKKEKASGIPNSTEKKEKTPGIPNSTEKKEKAGFPSSAGKESKARIPHSTEEKEKAGIPNSTEKKEKATSIPNSTEKKEKAGIPHSLEKKEKAGIPHSTEKKEQPGTSKAEAEPMKNPTKTCDLVIDSNKEVGQENEDDNPDAKKVTIKIVKKKENSDSDEKTAKTKKSKEVVRIQKTAQSKPTADESPEIEPKVVDIQLFKSVYVFSCLQ